MNPLDRLLSWTQKRALRRLTSDRRGKPLCGQLAVALFMAATSTLVASGAAANPVRSSDWLPFLTQQSLRDRDAALSALGLLGLVGAAVVVGALVIAGLLARGLGLDPPQTGPDPRGLGSNRGPRRSRSARRRREEP
jgi:hypothetical protein